MGEKHKHFFSLESYSIQNIEDSQLAKVELYVCHDKHNKNGSYFSIENMIKAQESIYRKPLLYRLNSFGDDFLEHEDKLHVAGFIDPLFNDLRYEEKNGKIYFVISAILWRVYVNDVIKILEKDGVKGISMEVNVTSSTLRNDGYIEIVDYTYLGIVLLGDNYSTGMYDTTAKIIFSNDDLDKMIKESENILRYRLQKGMNEKNCEKEDINMKDLPKNKAVEEKTEVTTETFAEEKVEETVEETTETKEFKEEVVEEAKEEMAEQPKEEMAETKEEAKEEMVEEAKETNACKKEYVEEPKEDLKEIVFSLNEKVRGLEAELSKKEAEIKTLAKFKEDRENELRQENVTALFKKFSGSLEKKELEEWQEKEKTFSSFEDFEKDISKFVLDKIFANMDSEKQVFAKMHVTTAVKQEESEKAKSVWDKIEEEK